MTAYDRAHAALAADPENEALRLAVYDRLADAELFLLLEEEPSGDEIKPQIFSTEEGDFVWPSIRKSGWRNFWASPRPMRLCPGG